MIPFKTIRARAEKRKGGPKALNRLLPFVHLSRICAMSTGENYEAQRFAGATGAED